MTFVRTKRASLLPMARRADLLAPTSLVVWLDATAITGLSDSDPVSSWDSLVSSESFTQGNASLQPTYETGVQNGLPGVQFVSGDYLAGSVVRTLKPVTMFAVIQFDLVDSIRTIVSPDSNGGLQWRVTSGTPNMVVPGVGGIDEATTDVVVSTTYLLDVSYSSSGTWAFGLDGVDDGTGTADLAVDAKVPQLGVRATNSEPFDGHIFEVRIYDEVLPATFRQTIRDGLVAKWGI